MNISSDKMVKFIKGTNASVYKINNKWQVVTSVSECKSRSLEGAICEAIKDHKDAIADGDLEAHWDE